MRNCMIVAFTVSTIHRVKFSKNEKTDIPCKGTELKK